VVVLVNGAACVWVIVSLKSMVTAWLPCLTNASFTSLLPPLARFVVMIRDVHIYTVTYYATRLQNCTIVYTNMAALAKFK